MGKAKPLSLHPLSFDEALKALIQASPEKLVPRKRKAKPKAKKK